MADLNTALENLDAALSFQKKAYEEAEELWKAGKKDEANELMDSSNAQIEAAELELRKAEAIEVKPPRGERSCNGCGERGAASCEIRVGGRMGAKILALCGDCAAELKDAL